MGTAGLLLTLGLVLGLAAAWTPSLGPVWNARPPERLLLISMRTTAWTAASWLFAAGLVAALLGVLVLSDALLTGGARSSGWIAAGSFVVGTTMWLIHLGYRVTVMVPVSRAVADGDEMPDWFLPSWDLGNYLLVSYVTLASIGLVALGMGVLETGLLPAWTGWTVIALATVFLTTIVVLRNTLPVFPHLATGLLGVVALLDPGTAA